MYMDKTFLTTTEAAAYIGTTANYLYKLASQRHRIPYYSPSGRKLLFKREELDEWILSTRVSTDEELERKVTTEAISKKGGHR